MMQIFSSKDYLKIDIANNFGLDKLNWDDRLDWFNQNEPHLLDLLSQAESPALFYAGIKAWEAVQNGEPIGYPVSLDATSSGIQILSVLTGDRSAAQLSNVLDTGKREDAYTAIYEAMLKKVGNDAQISRRDVKQAIMTAFYGSVAVPRKVFDEGPLLATFYETLEELTPAVWALNKAFLEIWDPEALVYTWVLPDNFHVQIKVMDKVEETVEFLGDYFTIKRAVNKPVKQGRSLGANVVHSIDGMIVRELSRRCDYDPEKIQRIQNLLDSNNVQIESKPENVKMAQILWDHYIKSGYLSARILDYLDSSTIRFVDRATIRELIDSLPKRPFKVLSVHDCFRVHPNYGNDLRKQYNLQLALIAQSDMLSYLFSQILGQDVPVDKLDHFAPEILESNYALS